LSNNLIFYDTETTGIHKDFSQIIQCGSILTDNLLNTKDQQNIGSAPLPWVIPQPKAMLTNKKINSFKSNISHYQMMKDIQNQWKEWCADNPSIFVTYNGHAFDEELIRRQFWCNLLEPYITNTNQNGRLDLMLMIHNVASFFSDEISIPLFEEGPTISIKLEHLAKEHGIDVSDAHDAISDCKFMIGLCKVIKEKIPEVFDSFLNISTKEGVKNLLYTDEFLALGEVYRRHSFKYPVVMCGADNSRPNDICFYDLSFDPDEILNLDFTEINKMVQSGKRDLPLKKYKINKTIPICSHKLLTSNNHFDISHDELQRRADSVKSNEDFFTKVSQAMEDRIMNFPEPDYLEGKIYSGGFPSYRDQDLMKEFHITDEMEHLVKISRNFEDERFRLLAERIICSKFEGEIPIDIKNRYDDLIHERVKTEGKWGSVEKSLQEIDQLIEETTNDEDLNILNATKEKISSMKK
jgi:exodeoxyribonuclease-1|tara:strand:+ start:940 stop:2337 length:1398 start_codon:yes stop_codon:yes gene_type:complete